MRRRLIAAASALLLAALGAVMLATYVSGVDRRAAAGMEPTTVLMVIVAHSRRDACRQPVRAGWRSKTLPRMAVADGALTTLADIKGQVPPSDLQVGRAVAGRPVRRPGPDPGAKARAQAPPGRQLVSVVARPAAGARRTTGARLQGRGLRVVHRPGHDRHSALRNVLVTGIQGGVEHRERGRRRAEPPDGSEPLPGHERHGHAWPSHRLRRRSSSSAPITGRLWLTLEAARAIGHVVTAPVTTDRGPDHAWCSRPTRPISSSASSRPPTASSSHCRAGPLPRDPAHLFDQLDRRSNSPTSWYCTPVRVGDRRGTRAGRAASSSSAPTVSVVLVSDNGAGDRPDRASRRRPRRPAPARRDRRHEPGDLAGRTGRQVAQGCRGRGMGVGQAKDGARTDGRVISRRLTQGRGRQDHCRHQPGGWPGQDAAELHGAGRPGHPVRRRRQRAQPDTGVLPRRHRARSGERRTPWCSRPS